MAEEKVLVVGLGEVGRAIFDLLKESRRFAVYGYDLDKSKMRDIGQTSIPSEVDVMHVCIPCTSQDNFVDVVADYAKQFGPNLVIINSTVPPGTTMNVYKCWGHLVAHSPFRGVHETPEHMKWELKRWTKYVGGANTKSAETARRHLEKLGLKVKILKSCLETELAKLFETTYRAWMVACFQEMHRISRFFGADFDSVVDFLEDTHRVRLDRPLMFPDVIGGHCVIPNTELLLKSYNSEFLRLILESNEKRREEKRDEAVQREIEKIKKRATALEKELVNRRAK